MTKRDERAHGVTPGLSRDYATRTAARQAAFVLPHLHSGMSLLDVGCGPGTITIGLAEAVAPGRVIGVDHDKTHIEAATALAAKAGVDNVTFQSGDACALPFDEGMFDAAFENNLFTHIPGAAVLAAGEIYRVLKPGAFFAARDADAGSVVWGHHSCAIRLLDRLFTEWQQGRGSDITLGKRLPEILREAGFVDSITSVTADTKATRDEIRSHADITLSLLDGPFGRDVVANGMVNAETIDGLKDTMREWANHPDAFFANVHVEVIGWKPAE